MAGKRHHIIPRFLQKGFASRIDGETISTWQYLKNTGEPIETSTKNTIVSKHFYGKGELNADDAITELESTKLSPLVNALRDGSCDFETRSKDIAELIAHLSIRSKLIRKGFENMSRNFVDGMAEIFGNEETVDGIINSAPESFLEDQFEAVLTDPNIPELDEAMAIFEHLGIGKDDVKSVVTGMIQNELQDPEIKKESVNQVTNIFRRMFDLPQDALSKSIKEGHIKALIANVVPEPRVEVFERFTWCIQTLNFRLILGDAPCLFGTEDHDNLVPSCDPQKAITVYLPISSNQLLVGSRKAHGLETTPEKINEAIARCSYEQFIAAESSFENGSLIPLIGVDAQLASDAEVESEVDQIRQNINELIYGEHPED